MAVKKDDLIKELLALLNQLDIYRRFDPDDLTGGQKRVGLKIAEVISAIKGE